MGKVLAPKPPKQDTSAIKAQEERLAKQEAEAAQKERDSAIKQQAALKARKTGGTRSLLTGGETGVKRDTLS